MNTISPEMMLTAVRERQERLVRDAEMSRRAVVRVGVWMRLLRRRPQRAVPLSRLVKEL
jgi:hypothetical protein